MNSLVKAVGWLALVGALVAAALPFVMPDLLANSTAILLFAFLITMGALLTGVAELIRVGERIADNTNWLTTATPPQQGIGRKQDPDQEEEAAKPDTSEDDLPEREPEPPARQRQRYQPAASRPAASQAEAELYDASRHPPAVEEWTHNGRVVMTLEDGSFASEVNGAWRRFMRLEDIDAAAR